MDVITKDMWHLEGHLLGCVCDACSYLRLWHLKEQVAVGEVNEGVPQPGSRAHFARWLVRSDRLLEAREEAVLSQ